MNYWVSSDATIPVPEHYAPLMARKGANHNFTSTAATCGMYRNTTICEATNRPRRTAHSRALHEKKRLRVESTLDQNVAHVQELQARLHQTQVLRATHAVSVWAARCIQEAWAHHRAREVIRLVIKIKKAVVLERWFRLICFRLKRIRASTCIQRYYRGWSRRAWMDSFTRMSAASVVVQTIMRGILGRRRAIRQHQSKIAVCFVVREAILYGAARAFFAVNKENEAATSIQRTLVAAWKRKKYSAKKGRLVLHNRRRAQQANAKTMRENAAKIAERKRKSEAIHRARRALLRCVTGARIIYTLGKVRPWGQHKGSSLSVHNDADRNLSSLPELAMFEDDDDVRRRKALAKKNRERRLKGASESDAPTPSLGKTVSSGRGHPRGPSSSSPGNLQPRAPNGFASSAQARRPTGGRVVK